MNSRTSGWLVLTRNFVAGSHPQNDINLASSGQTIDDNATLGLIDAFSNYPSLTEDSASNLVHQIITGIAASERPKVLKQELFNVLGNRKLSAVVKAASPADGKILQLMHVTNRSLPDNLTDDKLASLAKKMVNRFRARFTGSGSTERSTQAS